jgi:plasmid stabilization system protein ParE
VSLPVALRAEAQAEFDDAFDWYEARRPGLGVAFAAQVRDVFNQIAANPRLHAMVFADVRKAVVPRFPYCVYYRVEPTRIRVLSVFHSRRDPSIWQGRV